ncbi:hypothetical protein GOP47_0005614 [Adiantum capillus-veneris]|uniref:Glycosyltransferase n=1 Tax=Adiantum capillus-veneris TaxID=13818 RepID=A0A9D4V622_ADICA|nr:hypothetical protein GOP47_0005614 [Adiantum capillus-veneris]
MDLSRKLALLGVSVTFVCTEAYINSMLKQGFDAGGLPIRLHGLPDGLPQEKSITDSLENTHVSIRATENMGPALEELLNKLNMNEEGRVVCVVYDLLLWWVGRLGKELHIPAYIFNPMSSSFCSYVLLHIPVFVLQGRLPLGCQTDLSDKSNMFKIPDFPSLHVSEVPDISWDPNPVCPFDFIMRCATRWHDATGMLLNTVYELEKEVVDGLMEKAPELDIKAVGPILPASFLKGEMISDEASAVAESADVRRCFRWLDEQPAASVLYIAFGTIACLSEAQTQELAMGLEASKERFLWVMRIPDQQQKAGEERITRLLRSGFEERTAGRGMVLWELAPQRRILAHRAIAGFLTHCGWNSTLEALCKGVPMLCCPMFGDQGMNSKWVDEIAHTGKLLKREGDQVNGIVSRDEVERTTREVISTSSTLRSSAARIRDVACHAALDATGSSSKNLQAFVDTLSSRPIPA